MAHDHHHHHHHGQHGNPEDLDAYLAKLEDPSRDEWQRPDEVLRALALTPGATVADVGAGPGYFTRRLARAVGPGGHVFAVEVAARILERLRERIAGDGLRNVTPILALEDDPLLPPATCELILVTDTFHHFPDGTAYLRRLTGALKPGGRLVNIDFHKRELPVGPSLPNKVAREDFLALAAAAGLELVGEPSFLPHQYFLILRPRG
jgi:ubiquinone/menaquinone biosynthesis C-methylase UbiE